MVFDNEHYTMVMYLSITIVTFLIFFNSINIVETGLSGIMESGEIGKGLTGLIVDEIEENKLEEYSNRNRFDNYLGKFFRFYCIVNSSLHKSFSSYFK